MNTVSRWLANTLETAIPASAATTAAAALCGHLEEGNSVAPLNAISHILWGDEAATHDEASVSHTLTGIALNAAAQASWAAVYELGFGRAARNGNLAAAALGGVSVAGLAYVTDYHIVPKRLTPGFEMRLSPKSLFAIYATMAVTLPLASVLRANRRR